MIYSVGPKLDSRVNFRGEKKESVLSKENESRPMNKAIKGSLYAAGGLALGVLLHRVIHLKSKSPKITNETGNLGGDKSILTNEDLRNIRVNDVKSQIITSKPSQVYISPKISSISVESLKDNTNIADLIKQIDPSKYSEDTPKHVEEIIKKIAPHNYKNESSIIGITTRDKHNEFICMAFDLKNKIQGRSGTGLIDDFDLRHDNDINKRDTCYEVGDFWIHILDDKRRIVQFTAPTGRVDHVHRNVRTIIEIVSEGDDFSPIQKDLIKYISYFRKLPKEEKEKNISNILDLAAYKLDVKGTPETSEVHVNTNEDVYFKTDKNLLLSCIQSAKNMIKEKTDSEFLEKVFNLKKGEGLCCGCGLEAFYKPENGKFIDHVL